MNKLSWITSDTKKTIFNPWVKNKCIKVSLIWNDGDFIYGEYDGYGRISGIDIFKEISRKFGNHNNRTEGIDLFFKNDIKMIFVEQDVTNYNKFKIIGMWYKYSKEDDYSSSDCDSETERMLNELDNDMSLQFVLSK